MRRLFFLFLLVILAGLNACQSQKDISSGIPDDPASSSPPAPLSVSLPKQFSKMFTGSIAGRTVKLQLTGEDTKLSGFYVVTDDSRPTLTGPLEGYTLDGDISDSGQIRLVETDNKDNQTGKLYGTLAQKRGPSGAVLALSGTWTRIDGSNATQSECLEVRFEVGGGGKPVFDFFSDHNPEKAYTFDARFPFIKDLDAPWVKPFNELSKKQALSNLDKFKKEVEEFWKLVEKNGGKRVYSEDPNQPDRVFMQVDSEIRSVTERFISIHYTFHIAFGRVQAVGGSYVLNFDRQTGKEIKLPDLFAPNAKYLEKLSEICTRTAQAGSIKPEGFLPGLAPKAEYYQSWNLMPKGLVLTFGVGGKFQGLSAEFFIPYREIKDLLNPNGPLAALG